MATKMNAGKKMPTVAKSAPATPASKYPTKVADAYRRRWVYRRSAQAYCAAVGPPNLYTPSC